MSKYPSKCEQCGSRRMWLVESTAYYWRWPECQECGWRGEMESIPEPEREASDAAIEKAGL